MKKKRSNKKALIITLSAVALIAIIIAAFITKSNDKPIGVTFSKVERRTVIKTVSATGKIQPEIKVKISPEVSGEIVDLNVKEGDVVTKNMLLARINPAIIETQLAQQEAMVNASKEDIISIKTQLENLEVELKRAKELYEKKFVSKQELDKAQSTYDVTLANYKSTLSRSKSTEASFKQIQTEARKTTIFAPINGVVTSLLVQKGERVVGTNMMTGTEMMTVSDLNIMNAEVDVDENDIVLVKVGDTANVEIDAIPDKIYKGVVVEVGHSASGGITSTTNQTIIFKVKIRLVESDVKFRPGMSCSVEIQTEKHSNVLTVPLQAVTSREGELSSDNNKENNSDDFDINKDVKTQTNKKNHKTIVFIRQNGKAKSKEVQIGISDMGYMEITSGLNEGDEVISGSYQAISKLLSDGVKIKEEKPMSFKK